jgi:hypothetical protein
MSLEIAPHRIPTKSATAPRGGNDHSECEQTHTRANRTTYNWRCWEAAGGPNRILKSSGSRGRPPEVAAFHVLCERRSFCKLRHVPLLLVRSTIGAVESNGAVTFGLWLPWVSAGDGNSLIRKLLRIRNVRRHIRRRTFFFFNNWERYQSLGLLLFARYEAGRSTLVAVNTSDREQTVSFWFPLGGDYVEELHGGDLDLKAVPALQEYGLTIPSHYGRIWTST